jgi:histidine ammonia-lyase
MTVVLCSRTDIDLDAVERVAWHGESVRIAPQVLERMATCRRSFLALLDSEPELVVYGVTSGYGERAGVRLTPDERRAQAAAPPLSGATFGEPIPERVARAIVLARLANFLDGYAAVRPELAEAVAAMLNGSELAPIPSRGNGGSGEILALGHLFARMADELELEEKESLALVNGSPCAAALVADETLAARRRLMLAYEVFALSADALRAPLEAYAQELEGLWGDEHEAAALATLRSLLEGVAGTRRPYQAPVSYRILPRVLGKTSRALAAAEHAATVSLSSVTDNPVYVPPDPQHPLGRVWSTGGYHNAVAPAALDGLASGFADCCLLAERQIDRLLNDPDVSPIRAGARGGYVGILLMVAVGYVEEAREAAQPTLLPLGGLAQNDTGAPSFIAWERERRVADCLERALALLAAVASQTLWESRSPPSPALEPLLALVRERFPPVEGRRALGDDAGVLAAAFRERVSASRPSAHPA